jgi:hypothetical protein
MLLVVDGYRISPRMPLMPWHLPSVSIRQAQKGDSNGTSMLHHFQQPLFGRGIQRGILHNASRSPTNGPDDTGHGHKGNMVQNVLMGPPLFYSGSKPMPDLKQIGVNGIPIVQQ